MLPKINNKLFLTPELAPIFASKDDDLLQVLGTLTRVADGHGYESDTGAQGHRGYSEKMMFAWLGAAVEVPHKVHKHLAVLGPRLYFFRLPREEHTEDEYLYYCQNVSDVFNERLDKIRYALYDYLAYFELHPNIEHEPVRMEDEVVEDDESSESNGSSNSSNNGNGKRKKKVKTKIVIPPPPKIPFTGKAPEEIADKDMMDRYLIKLAPPWISWDNLPESYRRTLEQVWGEVWPSYKAVDSGGAFKKDLAALFVTFCFSKYLNDEGTLGFLIPFPLFKAQSARSFRRFLSNMTKIQFIHDLASLSPFEGATNRPSILICSHGSTKFPLKVISWSRKKGSSIDFFRTLNRDWIQSVKT